MASTTFIDNQTTIYAAWLNDVNSVVYDGIFQSSTITAASMVCTGTASGAGFTNLINNTFSSPGAIGTTTPNTGAFTTLTATTLTATGVTTPLPLKGTTSGTVSLAVPAVAGTNTITFPSGSGTVAVQGLSTNIVSGTAVATTSGTAIDFTGIPSWVKRITVMFNGVSTNGTTSYIIQIGAGSFTTSGYLSNTAYINDSPSNSCAGTSSTQGFIITHDVVPSLVIGGNCTITTLGSNVWTASGVINRTSNAGGFFAGTITLGGTLDRVRITTENGTDTFDAGLINILYE